MPKKGYRAHTIYLPEAWDDIAPREITILVTSITQILRAIKDKSVATLFAYRPELERILNKVAEAPTT